MSREEDMAGYAQQGGTETTLPPVKTIKISVEVTDVGSNGMAIFTMEGDDPPSKPYVDNATKTIRVPGSSQDVTLVYMLKDQTNGKDLDFCTGSPIWVTDQSACPTSECNNAEIEIVDVKKQKLDVLDHNSATAVLRFSLVLDSDSGRVLADPIIRNGP